jgi:hypothetical protein
VLLVFVIVDDIISFCQREDRRYLFDIKEKLNQSYPMRGLGELNWKLAHTPLPTLDYLMTRPGYNGTASPQDIHLYQQKVGSIQYATSITRPDAAQAASKLAEHLLNSSSAHMDAADGVIAYLYGIRTLDIEYSPDRVNCECSTDTAFANNENKEFRRMLIIQAVRRSRRLASY